MTLPSAAADRPSGRTLRSRFALRLYYFAIFAAFGAYLPYFPAWLEGRGIRGVAMSAIAALLPAMGVVGPPLYGLAADAFALRGALLRLACFGAAVPFAAVAAFGATGQDVGFLALFGLVFAFALFRSPLVMMADVVALEETREHGNDYGRTRLWGSVGFLVVALAAGRFVDFKSAFALPAVIAGALVVSLIASLGLPLKAALPPVDEHPSSGKEGRTKRRLIDDVRTLLEANDFRLFLVAAFLSQTAHASYDLCASLYFRDLGADGTLVGAAWSLGVVAEIALMSLSDRVFARISPTRLLVLGLAGAVVRWGATAFVPTVPLLFVVQPLHGLSFGLVWLACLAYLKGRVEPHVASTAQGVFGAAVGLGSVVGMFAWGPLYSALGGRFVFGAAAVVATFATGVAFTLHRVRAAEPAESTHFSRRIAG